MRRKKNNNLILVNIGKDKKLYFTSKNRASMKLGLAIASIDWAIKHKNITRSNNDEDVTIEIIDGSEIPYKYINND